MPRPNPTPSWLAGYDAGYGRSNEICVAIIPPDDYDLGQRTDFVSGFLAGARSRRNDDLIEEILEGFEE